MKKYLFVLPFFLVGMPQAHAVCPICTIAVGAGVGLSRWLGIDDMIAGLWIGGLTVSMIMWTLSWFDKKKIHFKGRHLVTICSYYVLIVVPLFFTGIMGHALNTLWGVDKLLIGIIGGSVVFYGGAWWYERVKKKNNGHAHFPFQKVVMPIAPLILLSILFYIFTP